MPATSVKGSVKQSGFEFEFNELKSSNTGAGNRGVKISAEGVADSAVEFWLSPNPHNVTGYNEGGAVDFYKKVAEKIVQGFSAPAAPPAFRPHTDKNSPPPGIKGPAWTGMNKQKQLAAIAAYNKQESEKAEAAAKEKTRKAVKAHLKSKFNKKVNVLSTDFTLLKS